MRILPTFLVLLPGLAFAQAPRVLSGPDVVFSLTHPGVTVLPPSVLPTGPGGVVLLDSAGKMPSALIPSGSGGTPLVLGTTSGTAAAGNDSRIVGAAQAAGLAPVATSGSYADLLAKPTIPVLPTLATVATSGSYADLTSKPTIPAAPALATSTTPGLMIAGTGLLVAGNGAVSVDSQVAPAASAVPALADLRVLLQDGTYLTGPQLKTALGVP